jgi:galactokinase
MTVEVRAPGRVNLIGEHTDYSGGLALPIAIDLGVTLVAQPALGISLDAPGGERLVDAVAAELAELGRPDVGLAGRVEADLPQGAGLGSSGAFEVAVALALCEVARFELEPLDLVLACRRAEQRAAGVASGILDQAASLLGQEGSALLLNCGTYEVAGSHCPKSSRSSSSTRANAAASKPRATPTGAASSRPATRVVFDMCAARTSACSRRLLRWSEATFSGSARSSPRVTRACVTTTKCRLPHSTESSMRRWLPVLSVHA